MVGAITGEFVGSQPPHFACDRVAQSRGLDCRIGQRNGIAHQEKKSPQGPGSTERDEGRTAAMVWRAAIGIHGPENVFGLFRSLLSEREGVHRALPGNSDAGFDGRRNA